MRKTLLMAAMSGVLLNSTLITSAQAAPKLEQRVERLERMLENPVLLQLSRRLGDQQREIQVLQDENDRLKRELESFKNTVNKRYGETDERLNSLETGAPLADKNSVSGDPAVAQVANGDAKDVNADEGLTLVSDTANVAVNSAINATSNTAASTAASAKLATSSMQEVPVSVIKTPADASVVESSAAKPTEQAVSIRAIQTRAATSEEKQAYKQAFSLMRASEYEKSISAFEDFLQRYPQSELASNAAYWAGEGYLVKGDSEAALKSFMVVLQQYPDSPKVPDATLRAGDSYDNLGQADQAKKLYEKVIKQRPHSKAAKNAQRRLEK